MSKRPFMCMQRVFKQSQNSIRVYFTNSYMHCYLWLHLTRPRCPLAVMHGQELTATQDNTCNSVSCCSSFQNPWIHIKLHREDWDEQKVIFLPQNAPKELNVWSKISKICYRERASLYPLSDLSFLPLSPFSTWEFARLWRIKDTVLWRHEVRE